MKKYRVHLNPDGCVDVVGEPKLEYGDGELAFYQKDSDIETAYFKPPYWRYFHLIEDEKGAKPDFTEDEMRELFLEKLWQLIDYWSNIGDGSVKDKRDLLSGLTHSILASCLDGNGDLPPMAIYPYIDGWEEWKEQFEVDIGGSLHELLYNHDPKRGK